MNKSESKYFNTALKMDLALIALLEKKPLAYITVSELCKMAGVNRSTFYLHYESLGDLLAETTRYLLDSFLSYFPTDTRSVAYRLSHCPPEELNFVRAEYLIPYLRYIKENKRVFSVALSNIGTLGMEEVYHRLFENIFNPILGRFDYPPQMRKYVMAYYLNGIHALTLEWLRGDCETSIEEIAEMITVCIFGLRGQLLSQ